MPEIKPIKIYAHDSGPNPWKVVIIAEELKIPYELEFIDFSVIKQEPFINVNPNGRVPAIDDPNTGVVVWESGAIIEYLLETYDKDNKLSYTTVPEKWQQSSWKHFQMSGQGPYFGQKVWFTVFHPEKNLTSVIDRYANEIRRVLGVIEFHLNKTGKPYLVGDKICFADLMFVPWNRVAATFAMGEDFTKEWEEKYPKCWAWNQKLMDRDSVKKAYELRAKALEKKG